jgi:hypothetical protein
MTTEDEAFDRLDAQYRERFGEIKMLFTPEISFTDYRDGVTQDDYFEFVQKCIVRGKPMTDRERAKFFEPFKRDVDY